MREDLLLYYNRELAYMRQLAAEFADDNRAEARRLLIEPDGSCSDPHVERLIEAFALIAARIHHKIDDEFPEVTESLLNVLYPHYLAPIPSLAVAGFALDPEQGKLTTGYYIKPHTYLDTRQERGTRCRFRTCYPVTVWPIEVASAGLNPLGPEGTSRLWQEASIDINLRCINDTTLSELTAGPEGSESPIDSLRFYLHGDQGLVYPLYEMIFNRASGVELLPGGGRPSGRGGAKPLPVPAALSQVGFAEDEGILPYTARSFMGYRLLTEYFAFPQKFLFFDVTGLSAAARRGDFGAEFSIRINLNNVGPPPGKVTASTFQLGCTPVVNLFRKTAEHLDLTNRRHEYPVIVNNRQQAYTEVYSVERVASGVIEERVYEPFYSIRHSQGPRAGRTFWYATRRPTRGNIELGTEVNLSFVDLDFDTKLPSEETLAVTVLASNRDLPAELNQVGFEMEGAGPLAPVRCLVRPTRTLRLPARRAAHWRLISHLSLNYLSLYSRDGEGATEALREILKLYDYNDSTATHNQIMGITHVTSRLATGVLSAQAGQRIGTGFARGIRTTVEFDEQMYVGGSVFLFASVLDHFMRMYASVNSFNQLEARSKQRGLLKRWPVRDSSGAVLAQPFADRAEAI